MMLKRRLRPEAPLVDDRHATDTDHKHERERDHEAMVQHAQSFVKNRRFATILNPIHVLVVSALLLILALFALQLFVLDQHAKQHAHPQIPSMILWSGEAIRQHSSSSLSQVQVTADGAGDNGIKTVELVIAYCKADTKWIFDDVLKKIPKGIEVNMTIISKCGNEKKLPKFAKDSRVKQFEIMTLPNVGGCDYAYAHFINHYVETATAEDAASSVIMFIKDTPRTMEYFHFIQHERYRTVKEMLAIASGGEFICGIKPHCRISTFHDTGALYRFVLGSYVRKTERTLTGNGNGNGNGQKDTQIGFNPYGYSSLLDFHQRALNWTFPNENVTEVCYGGTFAVPASRIMSLAKEPVVRQVMVNLEEILSRNATTTIEEHFSERTWAGLLANPLEKEDTDAILAMKGGIYRRTGSVMGPLMGLWNKTCGANHRNHFYGDGSQV